MLHTMDVEKLLAVDPAKAGVTIKKSLTRHQHPRMGVFDVKPFGRGMQAVHYYWSPIFTLPKLKSAYDNEIARTDFGSNEGNASEPTA